MRDMTEPDNLMDRREVLTFKLDELRRRHRALDAMIVEMEETSGELRDVELFRLDEDPAEADNRYAEVATFAVADVERLLDWATSNVQNRASRGIPLTSAERALLVKLGYVDED